MQFITEEEDKVIELFVLFSELVKGNYITIKTLTEEIKLDEDIILGILTKSIIPEDSFFISIENYFGLKLFPIIYNPNLQKYYRKKESSKNSEFITLIKVNKQNNLPLQNFIFKPGLDNKFKLIGKSQNIFSNNNKYRVSNNERSTKSNF